MERVYSLLSEFLHFGMGECEYLINVFQSVGIAAQRKVDEGDAKSSDVLYRQIRSSLMGYTSTEHGLCGKKDSP